MLAVLLGCPSGAALAQGAAQKQAQAKESAADKADLDALRARIEKLKGDIASSEETRNEARDSLRESERAISAANRMLRELSSQRDSARAELKAAASQRQDIEADLERRREGLSRLLAARYVHGTSGYAKLLLSGEDPNHIARELHYFGYVSRAQADFIRILRTSAERLRELEQNTREKTTELAGIEAGNRRERAELVRRQGERRKVLDAASERVRLQQREVKVLERDEARLTRLVQELVRAIAPVPGKAGRRNERLPEAATGAAAGDGAFDRLRGLLRLPIKGELVGRFGGQREGGGPSWKGLFIRGQTGQEVRAVAAGRVVFADWMRGFGNLLVVDHGSGYLTIYGNNEAVLKQVGDAVKGGDVVATVGASGGNADSGLYFEMRHEGKALDPLKWVSLK